MMITKRGRGRYQGASAAAMKHHYDVSNEFFRLWLGPTLAYSSALWEDGETDLETAQYRKMDYLIDQAGVAPGDRVLDIGCGYGTELRRMIEQCDIRAGVGVTLSESSVSFVRAQQVPRLEMRWENWVDHRPVERYDAVLSVEAFEHFARPGMSGARKIRAYRRFFAAVRAMIKTEGKFALQTITWGRRFPMERQLLADLYLATKVYPECNPAYLGEILRACDGLFDVVALRNDFTHYSRTTAAWVRRLEDNWDTAVDLIGAQRTADFHRCMNTGVRGFAEGWFHLHRLTLQPVPRPSAPARRFFVNNVLGLGPTPASARYQPV
ncbi:cyclopropane-fatty-acyl-phospholipid synthase [Pilimelia terevasa]|uniref:Cyclopropane-fatty-acyl-phospholipid synthase n=1 Tax=Pilimelia terevasa TaxID=53372 RepID=A0A8J3FJK4_9ACTN|nr:class I SAM-dependent methyltransferase [Pilimelia terevasa]GGK33950.1 cyclopropane-fatty-acyl-phospholipid synthase [Pilimelia terevasa]